MAKRKSSAAARRPAGRKGTALSKGTALRGTAKGTAAKTAKAGTRASRPAARGASTRKTASGKTTRRKTASPTAAARKAAARKSKSPARASTAPKVAKTRTVTKAAKTARTGKPARKVSAPRRAAATSAGRKVAAKVAAKRATPASARKTTSAAPPARPRAAKSASAANAIVRKAPDLDRDRRRVGDEDDATLPTPPSSLDLDRSASAVRSGRRAAQHRFAEHTETSPALTAGDVDADWESAYSVGDEAPGGDSPTPDQDIVDDIGRAVGIEYQDNEELKSADKVADRDAHRWELDPASSDDWDDRD